MTFEVRLFRLAILLSVSALVCGCDRGPYSLEAPVPASDATLESEQEAQLWLADPKQVVESVERPEPVSDYSVQVAQAMAGLTNQVVAVRERLQDGDLAALNELPNLRKLEITAPDVTSAGLKYVCRNQGLKWVVLHECPVDDRGMEQLASLPTLRILNLPAAQCTDDGLLQLKGRSSLELLRLSSPCVTDAGMAVLNELPNLRFLHLIDVRISRQTLKRIAGLPTLESFYIEQAVGLEEDLEWLCRTRPDLHIHIDQIHVSGPENPSSLDVR